MQIGGGTTTLKKNLEMSIPENELLPIDSYNKCFIDKNICGTIPAGYSRNQGTMLLIKNNTKLGYLEATDGDGIDISGRMKWHRGTVQKQTSQTITTMGGKDVGVIINDK